MDNRWLNIVGFGDFTGLGKVEIAAVVTPHFKGSLRVDQITGTRLVEIARIGGSTNHINGTRELDLTEVADRNDDGVIDITPPQISSGGEAVKTFAGGEAQELLF
jgi:hypothetical protein